MTPSDAFRHTLDALKGWPRPGAVDHAARLSAAVPAAAACEGRVAHLNRFGEFEPGVAGTQMALFLLDGDREPAERPPSDADGRPVADPGLRLALVATGGYELRSTGYAPAGDYAPNDLLTAAANAVSPTTAGVLDGRDDRGVRLTVPWAAGGTTRAVCGVVSRGVTDNGHGVNALAFWPVWLPGTT